jgi:peptidoglycan lytic transglycosylase
MARRPFGRERRRSIALGAIALGALALAACNSNTRLTSRVDPRYGVSASPRVIEPGQPVPKGGGTYRVGRPYVVAGRTYYPEENRRYRRDGIASWYGEDFHGRLTANGEIYDMDAISAAHPTMPMPSYARVTNLYNGRSLIVRVNDRGPYHADRVIDLSSKAAEVLELRQAGTGRVRVEYVGPAALEGSDDRRLLATLREGSPAPAPSAVMVASARPFVPDLAPLNPQRRAVALAAGEPPELGDGRIRPWTTDARALGVRTRPPDVAQNPVDLPAARQIANGPLPPPRGASAAAGPQFQAPSRTSATTPAAAYQPQRYDGAAVGSGRGLY